MKVIEPTEDQQPPQNHIGWASGLVWFYDDDAPEDARQPTDEELAVAMRELPAIRALKQSVRRKINSEVGDVEDLVADQAKQIEALTALTVRLAQMVLGDQDVSPELQQRYLERVTPIAQALDNGTLKLRGDIGDADDMLATVMGRADRINRIVADDYLPRRDAMFFGS